MTCLNHSIYPPQTPSQRWASRLAVPTGGKNQLSWVDITLVSDKQTQMKLISGNNKFIPTIKDCSIDTPKKRLVWEYVSNAKD